jgi:hypothetical protein
MTTAHNPIVTLRQYEGLSINGLRVILISPGRARLLIEAPADVLIVRIPRQEPSET